MFNRDLPINYDCEIYIAQLKKLIIIDATSLTVYSMPLQVIIIYLQVKETVDIQNQKRVSREIEFSFAGVHLNF